MASFRVPDVLEERPAQQNDEIGACQRFSDLRRIRRKRLTEARMAGREGCVVPQSFEPDRGADRLGEFNERFGCAGSGNIVAGNDRGAVRFQDKGGYLSNTLGIRMRGTPQISGACGLDRSLLLQHINRQGDEDGSPGRI